jgi:hypothetical protein
MKFKRLVCPLTEANLQIVQASMERAHRVFLSRCESRPLQANYPRLSDSSHNRAKSQTALYVAAVALTFRNLRLCFSPFISRKRSANIDHFTEGAIRLAAYLASVACMRFNNFPFTRLFDGHICSFQMCPFKNRSWSGPRA